MKPAVAAHEPLSLTGETLSLLAWHIPDLVAYQHNEDEWWFAPLDDNLGPWQASQATWACLPDARVLACSS